MKETSETDVSLFGELEYHYNHKKVEKYIPLYQW